MQSPPRTVLTSTANPRVRAALALRDRRDRDRTGMTVVDGVRELRRALDAGVSVVEAFICEPILAGPDARAVLDRLVERGATIHSVSETVFGRLSFGERAEGAMAVVRIPSFDLDELRVPHEPLLVVIEGVEKPGNLGAVLRSADGAGADAVLAADARTDPYNPNAIRASAGTVFTVPIAVASTLETLEWLRSRGVRTVAARVDAEGLYTDTDLTGPLALAFGAEAEGLSAAWSERGIEAIRLPMLGVADSLNVSVSAAVVLYEARRQRGLSTRTQ
jgi:RNA methyltransferase, TrmH family